MSTICKLFEELDNERTTVLDRARDCARHTIPTLFPDPWWTDADDIRDRYSNFAARSIMAMAAKITNLLAPPDGRIPFEHELEHMAIQKQLGQTPPVEELQALQRELNSYDRMIASVRAKSNYREQLNILIQHHLVIGDAVLMTDPDFEYSVVRLDNFVVRRSMSGQVVEAVIRVWVDPETLPDELKNLAQGKTASSSGNYQSSPSNRHEPIYTHLKWDGSVWHVRREFRDVVYDEGTYVNPPYFFSGWTHVAGENYCRSLVQDLLGDIRTDETLSKALVLSAVANSSFKPLVDPTGITEVADLNNSTMGRWVPGRIQDVNIAGLQRQIDVAGLAAARDNHRRELGKSFLSAQSIQRSGERVTATEWKVMAEEIDNAVGGAFTSYSRRLQLPDLAYMKDVLISKGLLPDALISQSGKKFVDIRVRTGLEALNREVEGASISNMLATIAAVPPMLQYLKFDEILRDIVNANNFDPARYVKTPEELQQEQQAAIEQQAAVAAGAATIDAAKQAVVNSTKQGTK